MVLGLTSVEWSLICLNYSASHDLSAELLREDAAAEAQAKPIMRDEEPSEVNINLVLHKTFCLFSAKLTCTSAFVAEPPPLGCVLLCVMKWCNGRRLFFSALGVCGKREMHGVPRTELEVLFHKTKTRRKNKTKTGAQ